MPLITIDVASPVPVYRQIADSLRLLLVDGKLKPGAQLPTVRHLAIDLGVHFNTVAQAYRLLSDEGWLEIRQGRSVMVIDRKHDRNQPEIADAGIRKRLRELAAEWRSQGVSPSAIARELRGLASMLEE
jgi:DNA-binding transcriptional regulator YhcF (GntR family)